MSTMKRFAALAILCICCVLAASGSGAKAGDLARTPAIVPRLNTLMMVTQLGHFKLWYAGAVQNWPLANYELAQIRANIVDAKQALSKQFEIGHVGDEAAGR